MTLPTAPRALAPWLLALCLTPLAAQQVFVVDVQGTTAWQQIQPAVQAASAGDVIRILPGVYLPFTCSKALRIEGSPGTIVAETTTASAMSISGIPAGSTCTIRGIDLRSSTTPCICEPLMMFDQCAGQVILDRVWPDYATSLEPKIQANAVASLLVNDSVVGPITAVACNLQLTRTQIRSASKDSGSIVQLTGSQFDMTDGTLNIRLSGTGEGIRLNNSTARLR
ncbi:MAG: hypothetical protein KAI24_26480, partial [Planctomycetes bacterium]|nr:hypothetical protein [Planctomycetota bacterium]